MLESCVAISKLFDKLKDKLETEITLKTHAIWRIPKINENSTIGQQIKYYRRLANIKQTDLCLKLGCDRGVLDHLENRELKLVNVKLIKDIMVEVQELLDRNSDMKYRKPSTSNALLSGILRCSHCGSFMRAKLKNKMVAPDGRRVFDYMCELKDKSRKQKCQCKNINGLEADDLVMQKIKELTNTNYDEISDKETADLLLNILDTYFTSFDTLDLNTKRNMIKLLVSSITTDGEDITINFLGARNMKDETFPTGANCKSSFARVFSH